MESQVHSLLSTGMNCLDQLLQGGVPKGRIVEITGRASSGKTSLLLSLLAQITAREEIVAYVDGFDSLDPDFAQRSGIDLKQLLWVRCKGGGIEKAVKAADILARAGGFGTLVLDIAPFPVLAQKQPTIPLHIWFRLQRAIKGTPTVLLVLSSQKMTGSAASTVLSMECSRTCWNSGESLMAHLRGIESEASVLRGRGHGTVQVYCRF
jgi:hypothetical protein